MPHFVIDQRGSSPRIAVVVQADRVERCAGDAESEILHQASLFQVDAEFQIVRAGRDGKIALDALIQQLARLTLRGW